MLRIWRLLVIAFLACTGILGIASNARADSPTIEVLRVKGTVNPVLVRRLLPVSARLRRVVSFR